MGSRLLPACVSAAVLTVQTDDGHGLSRAVRRERSRPLLRYGGSGGGRRDVCRSRVHEEAKTGDASLTAQRERTGLLRGRCFTSCAGRANGGPAVRLCRTSGQDLCGKREPPADGREGRLRVHVEKIEAEARGSRPHYSTRERLLYHRPLPRPSGAGQAAGGREKAVGPGRGVTCGDLSLSTQRRAGGHYLCFGAATSNCIMAANDDRKRVFYHNTRLTLAQVPSEQSARHPT